MRKPGKKAPDFFVEGAIHPLQIGETIAFHATKTGIGAHDIFLGQVRADAMQDDVVQAIEFSAYRPMADELLTDIREEMIQEFGLTCAHVLHSLGHVKVGELCFMVFVSAPHRAEAFAACQKMTNRIKAEVPIFGKILGEQQTQWKENTP
jgi:molybdopterin synthase catalytic subunit